MGAEVSVFIGEFRTLTLITPPCWALDPGPTHAVEILPLTHTHCHLACDTVSSNIVLGKCLSYSALFTLVS